MKKKERKVLSTFRVPFSSTHRDTPSFTAGSAVSSFQCPVLSPIQSYYNPYSPSSPSSSFYHVSIHPLKEVVVCSVPISLTYSTFMSLLWAPELAQDDTSRVPYSPSTPTWMAATHRVTMLHTAMIYTRHTSQHTYIYPTAFLSFYRLLLLDVSLFILIRPFGSFLQTRTSTLFSPLQTRRKHQITRRYNTDTHTSADHRMFFSLALAEKKRKTLLHVK